MSTKTADELLKDIHKLAGVEEEEIEEVVETEKRKR